MDFDAGYVQRVAPHAARSRATASPWPLRQNYLHDARTIRRASIDDGALRFG